MILPDASEGAIQKEKSEGAIKIDHHYLQGNLFPASSRMQETHFLQGPPASPVFL